MNEGLWLKWAWHDYSMTVKSFGSLDAALEDAWYASEVGSESLDHIEGPDGIVAKDIIEADHERRSEADYASSRARPVVTHRIYLKTLDGKNSAVVGWSFNEADSLTDAAQRREVYGDRIFVEPAPAS